jgi:hypothetical protein
MPAERAPPLGTPGPVRQAAATGPRRHQVFGAILATAVGAALLALVLAAPEGLSEGVPVFVGVAAGGTFLLAGLVLLGHATGWVADGGLLHRVLVALLLTCFAGVAAVFPPSLLFVGVIAVLGWIGVYRRVHERAFGRDPMGGMSQEKQLGVGCLATLALLGGIALVVRLRRPSQPAPSPPLPAEAPAPGD